MNTKFGSIILPHAYILCSKRGVGGGGKATDFVSMTQGIDLNPLAFGPGGVIYFNTQNTS